MTKHPDVLILGGGVIGLSTAWFLAEAGVRVTIVDKDESTSDEEIARTHPPNIRIFC